MTNIKEKTDRITLAISKKKKDSWKKEASKRHWTITTLIEQAVNHYIKSSENCI